MQEPRDIHRSTTMLLSAVMLVLGIAMIVVTLAGGGGPLALGILMGILFAAAGGGRLYAAWRRI